MEIAAGTQHKSFGNLCRLLIDNVRFAIRIFGYLMKKLLPQNVTNPLEKKVVKPVILKGLIILYANEFQDL